MAGFYDRYQLNRGVVPNYNVGLAEAGMDFPTGGGEIPVVDLSTISDGTGLKPTDSFLGSLDFGKLGDMAGLAGSLANTFMGFKQLGLAEDAFNFNKDMKTKEYQMAKDAYDRNVRRAESISDQMRAGRAGG